MDASCPHASLDNVVHNQNAISIPQAAVWLLRVASDRAIAMNFLTDAVAFSGWYAVIGDSLYWPEAVVEIQKSQRNKKLSLERMMKLLSEVSHAFAGRTTADHARRALEGYAVHDWVVAHFQEFTDLTTALLNKISPLDGDQHQDWGRKADGALSFSRKLSQLGQVLNLSKLEGDILAFAFLTAASDEIAGVFEQFAADRWSAERVWTVVFKTTREALTKAMRPRSPLRLCGLLLPSGRRTQMASVSPFWIDLMSGTDALTEAILEPLTDKVGSGMPARLLEEDMTLATEVLRNAKEPGVNLLLYGAAKLEKQQLVGQLVAGSGRTAWRVRKFEDAGRNDLPALTYVAFQLLGMDTAGQNPLLVVERPSDVLQTAPSDFLAAMFGIELTREDTPAFDENLLEFNPVPGLWLASSVNSLPDDTIARFVFHAPLKKADKKQRMAALQLRLQGLKLGRAATENILKLEGVSSAQLDAAVKAARLSGAKTKKDRDLAIVQAVLRSQKALARDVKAKIRTPVTHYSLEYLNTAGRFGPAQILECFRRNPKGAMVLYGPPGTGKSEFVAHMAAELGHPLLAKKASELLSKYVGEAEKNIAAAFEEASSECAILLLDEGDSFLRDRTRANADHEVTRVNEMLQAIENFDGIVVVCTNLFSGLDAAALRRFTFKVEFKQLDNSQRWMMFVNETGLKGQLSSVSKAVKDAWVLKLNLMMQLTPGDFATVKRQCILLDQQLNPEEWLVQLQLECDVKNQAQ